MSEPNTPTPPSGNGNGDKKWLRTREQVLLYSGLILIGASFFNSEIRGATFHLEFVIAGLALCGVSITQFGDRKMH